MTYEPGASLTPEALAWQENAEGRVQGPSEPATVRGCSHPLPDLGRFEVDVCHACGEDVDTERVPSCSSCDMRLAVVAVHRLADVALHVTLSPPWGADARCLECCLDDLTRLVVKP